MINRTVRTAFYIFFTVIALQCARFRIEELTPTQIFTVNISVKDEVEDKGQIPAKKNGRIAYNFPIKPATDGSSFYISDPENHLIRVFSATGDLIRIIGNSEKPPQKDVDYLKANIGIPGWIVTNGDNLYIQTRKEDVKKEKKKIEAEEDHPELQRSGAQSVRDFAPSHILVIADGKTTMEIGEEGKNSTAFERIIRMDANDKKLYVLHTRLGIKTLSVYDDGKLLYRVENFNPGNEKELREYHSEIEDIVPRPNSNQAIASVVYRRKKDFQFQYRKIYNIDTTSGKYEEIAWLDDPEEHFFWVLEDGGFYILHVEDNDSSRILLRIYSSSGEYLNNRQITLTGIRPAWRETFSTLDGKIYTTRIFKNKFEIYQWR